MERNCQKTTVSRKMANLLEKYLFRYQRPIVTDVEISALSKGTPDSRYGQIKRLLAQHKLIRIRRGLYCISDQFGQHTKPHPFELAQFIYGPSYISFESALSFHQLIPEAVYGITSACIQRSKTFNTPIGIYSYTKLPMLNFYLSVDLVSIDKTSFFIAKPWKALCDYVFYIKIEYKNLSVLCESLRIDLDELPLISKQEIAQLNAYYRNQRVSRFLAGLMNEGSI